MSQAFSIVSLHEQAMDVKDEVSFFQAIKSRSAKFGSTDPGKTAEEFETAIRQVIDIFDTAGNKNENKKEPGPKQVPDGFAGKFHQEISQQDFIGSRSD